MKAELETKLLDKFGKFLNLELAFTTEMGYLGEHFRCRDGWFIILYMFLQELEDIKQDIRFSCVKEKYGWLRVYPDFQYCVPRRYDAKNMLHPDILAKIHLLEWKSYETCEFCGQPGTIRWDYEWIRTLCDGCVANYDSKPRIWSGDIRAVLNPGGDLKKLAGYRRVG